MLIEEINVYRVTHIRNIIHILENGITHKDSANANPDYITIGDESLIETRSGKKVEVTNGEKSTLNPVRITLGNYIPFHFGIKMPMLYVIQVGGNFVKVAVQPEDIIYIVCSLEKIIQTGTPIYFSDGHATDSLSVFYDQSKVIDLPEIIDWNAVRKSYWGGIENLEIKRKKQAELLVSSYVPKECIILFGCYNENAKVQLLNMGIAEQNIKIKSSAYF
jgi:hypothetical protein